MSEQPTHQNRQSTSDERERAADAESYGGAPIDDAELADVWTTGDGPEPRREPDTEEAGATSVGPATDEPTD